MHTMIRYWYKQYVIDISNVYHSVIAVTIAPYDQPIWRVQ